MQNRLKTTKRNQETHQKQLDELRAVLENEKADRQESVGLPLALPPTSRLTVRIINSTFQDERQDALSKLTGARTNLHDLERELTQYGACDPVVVEEKQRALVLAKEAAVRWTGKDIAGN